MKQEDMMLYADKIRRLAPGYDPRHVAAWMILGNGGAGRLERMLASRTSPQVEREVELAIDALKRRSPEFSERLAKAAGL